MAGLPLMSVTYDATQMSPMSRLNTMVPLEGFEPPTRSLGRSGSSTELQRLAHRF